MMDVMGHFLSYEDIEERKKANGQGDDGMGWIGSNLWT